MLLFTISNNVFYKFSVCMCLGGGMLYMSAVALGGQK